MITKVKLTNAERQNHIQQSQMQQVCDILGWTAEQYCWHQFQEYEALCNELWAHDPHQRDVVRYSPVFRGFWTNDWTRRNNVEFLPFAYDVKFDELEGLTQQYIYTHNHLVLLNCDTFFSALNNISKLI